MSYEDLGKLKLRSPIGFNFKGGFKVEVRAPAIQVKTQAAIDSEQKSCAGTPIPAVNDQLLVEAYLRRNPGSSPAQAEAAIATTLRQRLGPPKDCTLKRAGEGFFGIHVAKGSEIDRCCMVREQLRTIAAKQQLYRELDAAPAAVDPRAKAAMAAGAAASSAAAARAQEASRLAAITAAANAARRASSATAASGAAAAAQAERAAKERAAAAAAAEQAAQASAARFPWLWVGVGVAALGVSAFVLTRR